MAMKLHVMRHGYAGPPSSDPTRERERPLLPEGVAMVKAVVRGMIDAGEIPNVIFCSPLTRATQTADLVGKTLTAALQAGAVPDKYLSRSQRKGDGPPRVQVNTVDDFAPNRPLEERILELMSHGEVKRIMIVGHVDNTTPAFNNLAGDGDAWDPLVMAEVRRLKINRKTGEWKLKWALKPSDLGLADRK